MEGSPTVNKTKAVEGFCRRHKTLFLIFEIEERRSCTLDYKILIEDETFFEEWPNFQEDLCDNPEHSLSCLGLAVHQVNECNSKIYNKTSAFTTIIANVKSITQK